MNDRIGRGQATAAVAAWLLGAALSRRVGIWTGLGATGVALGLLVVVTQRRRIRGWLAPRPRDLLVGLGAALAMTALTRLLYPFAARALPWIARDTLTLFAFFHTLSAGAAALALVPVVLAEELLWRGLVQSALEQRWGRGPALALAALIYGAAMAPTGSPVLVMTALACGLVWSTLRAATGALVAPLLCHLLWDVLVLFPGLGRA